MGNGETIYAGKRALVTGGAGFIGSHLARRLHELGAEVSVVDAMIPNCGGNLYNLEPIRDAVALHIVDMRDCERMRPLVRAQDFILNLAGKVSHIDSMQDPHQDQGINCESQLALLETCRCENPSAPIVYASTRQQYGRPLYTPVDEDHPLLPTDFNGINKLAGEWYHRLYARLHRMQITSLRLTNTYGPGLLISHDRQGFLSVFIRRVLTGEPIRVFGDGSQLRDLNYVDDVVDALLAAAARPDAAGAGEVYNLGSPEAISLKEVAELMVRIVGCGRVELVPFPNELRRIDIGSYQGDFRRIHKALGWQPRISVEEGLRRTLAFYREHGGHYL
ncbi:MAG: NAD-dependent epimerase/dehydratase family protein [Candidatus Eisenbacteria sp.]|nr:NAD-dependent epimerase/dehydratase family protein [Candidatus Eisenbacteria bacterium]